MNNLKKVLCCIFFLVAFSLKAQEGIPCLHENGTFGLNEFEKFDCKAVALIVQDPKVKESYEDKIFDNLASVLEKKVSQSLEEVTLLDQFYSHHNRDMFMGNDDVKNKCRLEVIAQTECQSANGASKVNKKLEKLLSKFTESKEGNLYEKLFSKVHSLRAPKLEDKLQCPLSGVSGYFSLESQLNEVAALQIIEDFKMPITSEVSQKSSDERKLLLEGAYPQLRLLKNADLAGGKGIAGKFQEYVSRFEESKGQSRTHYINSFFLDQENQASLSAGLASQCESVGQSIQKYLCEDLSHLGTTQDFAEQLFGDSKTPEIEIQVSKGFSCEYKNLETSEEDIEKLTEENSIQHRYEQINTGLRPAISEKGAEEITGPFCDMYSCKTPDSKKLKSCQSGGPVSYEDLESTFCPKYSAPTCTVDVQKSISYLKTLKDTQNIIESSQSLASDTKSSGPTDIKPRKRYSSFFENFVGVKGSLKAEGRPITSTTIAQKEAEFTERKLSLSSKSSSTKSSPGASKEVAQKETTQQKPQQPSPSPMNNAINYEKFMKLGEAQKEANEKMKKDIIDRANSKYIAGASGATNTSISSAKSRAISAADAERNSEIEKLRSELASVADSIKGTPEQKLATIAANNSTYEPMKSNYDPQKAMNQAEKERLARYRDNLDARDEELRKREFEARTSSFGRNTESEKRQEAARAAAESANSNSSSGSGTVKLSKASSNSAGGGVSGSSDSSSKGEKAAVTEIAETDFVSSEKLATLGALKDLGMEGKESFIMRVRHNGKIYEIPVKTFTYKEKKILVPLLSEKNRELAQIVFESPLFSDYQKYQLDKQKDKK
jgi:hypothetical protein